MNIIELLTEIFVPFDFISNIVCRLVKMFMYRKVYITKTVL